jgi:hypothetical protein
LLARPTMPLRALPRSVLSPMPVEPSLGPSMLLRELVRFPLFYNYLVNAISNRSPLAKITVYITDTAGQVCNSSPTTVAAESTSW